MTDYCGILILTWHMTYRDIHHSAPCHALGVIHLSLTELTVCHKWAVLGKIFWWKHSIMETHSGHHRINLIMFINLWMLHRISLGSSFDLLNVIFSWQWGYHVANLVLPIKLQTILWAPNLNLVFTHPLIFCSSWLYFRELCRIEQYCGWSAAIGLLVLVIIRE